jgi:uncharacterized damage-inducible protein DinB
MSEMRRIVDQLERAYRGEAWHGPALREVLKGVTARQAFRRALPRAHSIAELVLHITAWTQSPADAIIGTPMPPVIPEFDWPVPAASTARTWRLALDSLDRAHRLLISRASGLTDRRMKAIVPGRKYDFYFLLQGVIQHNLYHAGQIAILKKR